MQHPAVADIDKGKFSGMRNAEVIAYIKALGVTSIELMPIQAFIDEHHLANKKLRNFWGYNTVGFFAPMPRYGNDDPLGELQEMVRCIHDAGLEVILDVAYNHTGEGDAFGPSLFFRGIDNLAYYRVEADQPAVYINDTGCGNTVNVDHPRVRQLVVDSLAYFAGNIGVDGFRFDLATILGRHDHGYSAEHPLLREIGSDPRLVDAKLVAEPWDPGPGGYQLGQFPPRWAEWNDKYRDTIRRFWRGDHGMLAEFAQRIHGSSDLFDHPGRGPWSSVNFIASHDGFTAMDLVSYSDRHNEANGEDNRDGHDANFSSNYGVEGKSDDSVVLRRRERQVCNMLATVLLSHGTPMLLAGDEFARTQGGNNNAYCQDNETTWVDWSLADEHAHLLSLMQRLVRLRKKHSVLCREHFPHGNEHHQRSGFSDITWLHPRGTPMQGADWEQGNGCVAVLLCEVNQPLLAGEEMVLLVFNPTPLPVLFKLPSSSEFDESFIGWQLALSTAEEFETGANEADVMANSCQAYGSEPVMLPEASVCVFEPQARDEHGLGQYNDGADGADGSDGADGAGKRKESQGQLE